MMEEKTRAQILELWALNEMSTRQIAEQVGVTKNAVCGFLKRMRDQGHDVPHRPHQFTPKKEKAKKVAKLEKVTRLRALPKKAGPRERPVAVVPPPQPKPDVKIGEVKFIDLRPYSCRYIVSGKRAEEFLFCGAPKIGRAYCAEHAKLCYIPTSRETRPKTPFILQQLPGEK